jgi:hypothetical protein
MRSMTNRRREAGGMRQGQGIPGFDEAGVMKNSTEDVIWTT